MRTVLFNRALALCLRYSLLILVFLIHSKGTAALHPKDYQRKLVVAVIDTGFAPTKNLEDPKLWKNLGEVGTDSQGHRKELNGIDDDNNGYIDDLHGWDFVGLRKPSDFPYDDDGHGTHVTNVIYEQARKVQRAPASEDRLEFMILRYYGPKASGEENLARSLLALRYAIKNGARVINYSGGGSAPNAEEFQILKEAQAKGIVILSAAGNLGQNTDQAAFFPASYELNNILPVVALDQTEHLHPQSNYSPKRRTVAAPGEKILARIPGGQAKMTGTSQATAFATGILAGLMLESMGQQSVAARSATEWIDLLMEASSLAPQLAKKMRAPLRLDISRAREVAAALPVKDLIRAGFAKP